MPLFAILHLYAFSHKDYEDPKLQYSGRMPLWYALRDSVFGFKDVLEDSLTTLKGTGFSYRTFEPAEGALHQGEGRERRVRAGLRYAAGGKAKYWLPMPGASEQEAYGRKDVDPAWKRPFAHVGRIAGEHEAHKQGYAPITPQQAETVIHRDPREDGRFESPANPLYSGGEAGRWDVLDRLGPRAELEGVAAREYDSADSDDSDVDFADPRADEERLYKDARQLEFGPLPTCLCGSHADHSCRRLQQPCGRRFEGTGKTIDARTGGWNPLRSPQPQRQRAQVAAAAEAITPALDYPSVNVSRATITAAFARTEPGRISAT